MTGDRHTLLHFCCLAADCSGVKKYKSVCLSPMLLVKSMLKYCVNFAIDNSIFVDIFRKIMKMTIISPAPKYIAGYIIDNLPSTNTNQAFPFAFFLSR